MDNRMPQDEGLSMAELQGPEAPKLRSPEAREGWKVPSGFI